MKSLNKSEKNLVHAYGTLYALKPSDEVPVLVPAVLNPNNKIIAAVMSYKEGEAMICLTDNRQPGFWLHLTFRCTDLLSENLNLKFSDRWIEARGYIPHPLVVGRRSSGTPVYHMLSNPDFDTWENTVNVTDSGEICITARYFRRPDEPFTVIFPQRAISV